MDVKKLQNYKGHSPPTKLKFNIIKLQQRVNPP